MMFSPEADCRCRRRTKAPKWTDGKPGRNQLLCRTPFARREPIVVLVLDDRLLKFELKAPLFPLPALKFELQTRPFKLSP